MQDKESSLPEDWFKKGDDDKQAVGILLEHGGKSSVAAFLIQQILEKYTYHESLKLIQKIDELYRQISD